MRFIESVKGTYAAVNFTDETLDLLVELQNKLKLPNPTPRDKLHCTILYSRVYVPFIPSDKEILLADSAWLEVFETRDNYNALVLRFDSDHLQFRHMVGKALGATYDFPDYLPHVTLSYDIGSLKFDLNNKFETKLVAAGEYVEDLDPDWTA